VELQWHAAPSKEPGGPPNRRQPWYLCKLHAGAFEIHGATQQQQERTTNKKQYNLVNELAVFQQHPSDKIATNAV